MVYPTEAIDGIFSSPRTGTLNEWPHIPTLLQRDYLQLYQQLNQVHFSGGSEDSSRDGGMLAIWQRSLDEIETIVTEYLQLERQIETQLARAGFHVAADEVFDRINKHGDLAYQAMAAGIVANSLSTMRFHLDGQELPITQSGFIAQITYDVVPTLVGSTNIQWQSQPVATVRCQLPALAKKHPALVSEVQRLFFSPALSAAVAHVPFTVRFEWLAPQVISELVVSTTHQGSPDKKNQSLVQSAVELEYQGLFEKERAQRLAALNHSVEDFQLVPNFTAFQKIIYYWNQAESVPGGIEYQTVVQIQKKILQVKEGLLENFRKDQFVRIKNQSIPVVQVALDEVVKVAEFLDHPIGVKAEEVVLEALNVLRRNTVMHSLFLEREAGQLKSPTMKTLLALR